MTINDNHERIILFSSHGDGGRFDELEKQINAWLSDNPEIRIIFRQMTTCAGQKLDNHHIIWPVIICTVAIFYTN